MSGTRGARPSDKSAWATRPHGGGYTLAVHRASSEVSGPVASNDANFSIRVTRNPALCAYWRICLTVNPVTKGGVFSAVFGSDLYRNFCGQGPADARRSVVGKTATFRARGSAGGSGNAGLGGQGCGYKQCAGLGRSRRSGSGFVRAASKQRATQRIKRGL
jgi:hypothetical protein